MQIQHFFDEATFTLSYVVHDGRVAVVIDPVRDYDPKSGLTSWAGAEAIAAFVEGLGKTTILAKDTPGFVINVLLVPYLCDAVRLLEAGVATKEDIDKGMMLGCGMPMGPITLLDFVGLDTTLAISEVLHGEFGDPKYAAPPLLRRMVESGFMGKKCGRGFYDYSTQPPTPTED